ncbi:hypothetical protein M513_04740 [Trichuris suis]|uniref:Uncharacterized protein n=1 Tax=Trichuris suis TaxID=68888 RepID=A0A085MB01_9BILA|nr:hypothetical protein M513_04740 [Trichuris suis]
MLNMSCPQLHLDSMHMTGDCSLRTRTLGNLTPINSQSTHVCTACSMKPPFTKGYTVTSSLNALLQLSIFVFHYADGEDFVLPEEGVHVIEKRQFFGRPYGMYGGYGGYPPYFRHPPFGW